MQPPAYPEDEGQRLQALRELAILDTSPKERFDRLTRLAQRLFQVPIVLVSLVDAERQWFKSRQGLAACETGRDISFCGHAILSTDILEVPDALLDPRFFDNPLVTGSPHIRFYAGAPLAVTDGYRVGTLCIMSDAPRQLSSRERAALRDMADLVEQELSSTRALLEAQEQQYRSLVDNVPGVTYRCLPDSERTILYISDQICCLSGYPARDFMHSAARSYSSTVHPADVQQFLHAPHHALQAGSDEWDIEYRILHSSGTVVWVHERGRVQKNAANETSYFDCLVMDVTGRKNYEEDIRKQRWLYETILEHSLAGYWDWNIKTGDEYLSPAFKKMFGYEDDEMCNRAEAWQSIVFEEDLPKILRSFDEHVISHGAMPYDNEVRYRHKDGRTVWVRCTGQVVEWDSHGAPVRMIGCHIDISEHKASNDQVQHQLSAFSALNQLATNASLESSEQIARALDIGRDYLQLELAIVSQIRGEDYQIRALLSPPDMELSAGQVMALGDTYCDMVVKSGELVAIDRMDSSKYRGHPCYQKGSLETYIGVALAVHGQPYGTLNFSSRSPRDKPFSDAERMFLRLFARWLSSTIERERDSHAIRQSETRLRGLFELSSIGIALTDLESEQVVDVNPALIRSTGYSRHEIIDSKYWATIFTPELDSLESADRYSPREIEVARKDGGCYQALRSGIVVNDLSGRRLVWSIIEDITERRRIERMKSDFVSTVSHELRTPLTSISGALELIASGKFGDLPERMLQLINIARKNSGRLTCLIDDLLDMDRLLVNQMPFYMRVQPLLPLLEESIKDNYVYASQNGVRLVLVQSWKGGLVEVDGQRLQQILANLLSNAVKFSPKGEEVVVAATRHEHLLRVSVSDRGPGIPLEFHARVFDKFSQMDSSDSREKGGTGLGLAISRELVERMGGSIGFASAEGQGTTFFFDLPIVAEATGAQETGYEDPQEQCKSLPELDDDPSRC